MLHIFISLFETKKEIILGFSLTLLYIAYYLVEVVKRPRLVCAAGAFRECLERDVPLLRERYWPTPWCVESRLHTVVASVLRSSLLPSLQYRRQVLALADGGQVALDWLLEREPLPADAPVLVLLPGLTGASQADYVKCLADAARALGVRCVVFNNRGLGGLPLTSPRLYCAASHDDLAEVVRAVRQLAPAAPLLAAGVSLGGLILGNYLAAHGERALLQAALIISSPLNVLKGSECIERPLLNALLSRHMARNLRNTLRAHPPLRHGPWDWDAVNGARSVREFDAAFTTKHFGYVDVDAYYRDASLHDKLHAVRVPLLCLCAADDPFQPAETLPAAEAAASSRVALAITARGGHIGFLEGLWPGGGPPRAQYMARLTEQYFGALLACPELLHYPAAPAPAPSAP